MLNKALEQNLWFLIYLRYLNIPLIKGLSQLTSSLNMIFWGLENIDEWTYSWSLNHHSLLLKIIYIFYFVIGNVFAKFFEMYGG